MQGQNHTEHLHSLVPGDAIKLIENWFSDVDFIQEQLCWPWIHSKTSSEYFAQSQQSVALRLPWYKDPGSGHSFEAYG